MDLFNTPGANMDRITLEPGKRGGRPCIRGLAADLKTLYDRHAMAEAGFTVFRF